MYFDRSLIATETDGSKIAQTDVVQRNPNFNIGRDIRGEAYAAFAMSSFTTFNSFIYNSDIMNVFIFFYTSGIKPNSVSYIFNPNWNYYSTYMGVDKFFSTKVQLSICNVTIQIHYVVLFFDTCLAT